MKRSPIRPLRLFLALAFLLAPFSAHAEDIPLQTCDRLPVVEVTVAATRYIFLVDTGATSMLNLKSFSHGDQRTVSVTSWNGTKDTPAQDVTLRDLIIGDHHLNGLKLPAVDLSQIGLACGRRIDGILGVDLLSRLGATVDIKNRIAHLAEAQSADDRIAELHQRLGECEQAFNRADEAAFADCLAPSIVLFSSGGDYYGRDASMDYYRRQYFRHDPPAHLQSVARAHHALGDAIWVEYDLRITVGPKVIEARGTALCEKSGNKWRIVHMNHSVPPESLQSRKMD
jgi:ketosteroid isomerase-like protein